MLALESQSKRVVVFSTEMGISKCYILSKPTETVIYFVLQVYLPRLVILKTKLKKNPFEI